MEPTVYKSGAYKTPGVYTGAGGIYNSLGVYNGSGLSNKVKIGSIEYKFVQINNKLWTAENFKEPIEHYSINTGIEKYGFMYSKDSISIIEGLLHDGWRIANNTDWNELANYSPQSALRDTDDYSGSTNDTGLSLVRSGWYVLSSNRFYNGSGRTGRYKIKGNNDKNAEITNSSIIIQSQSSWNDGDYWINFRFCKTL